SSDRKRSWILVIGLLQEWAQSLPRVREVHSYGRLTAPQDAGDLAGRKVGVLVQDGGGALVRAQARERPDQIRDRFRHLVAEPRHLARAMAPRLQFPCRDTERRSPDPPVMIANSVSAP